MAHFFLPPSTSPVTTIRLGVGESVKVGLWGMDRTTGRLKPALGEKVAHIDPSPFPPQDGADFFALSGTGVGHGALKGAAEDGRVWAEATVIVSPAPPLGQVVAAGQGPLPAGPDYRRYPDYVDRVVSGEYDIESDRFTLRHPDGTTSTLSYRMLRRQIAAARVHGGAEQSTVTGVGGYRLDLPTRRIHPFQYNAGTVPNIAAMVEEVEALMRVQMNLPKAVIEILAYMGTMRAAGAAVLRAGPGRTPDPTDAGRMRWRAQPKNAAVEREIQVHGNKHFASVGELGAPGNFKASVEEANSAREVLYRVEYIITLGKAQNEAARFAAALHREMLRRAAQLAKANGKTTFTMKGVTANANFRAHADQLARSAGVPGSGRATGAMDYEVTLDAAKILAGSR